jgi:RNA polymerase sigma-70 factor (ECF subfamily)
MNKEIEIAKQKGFTEKDLDDIMIISKIKSGDNQAFGMLYQKYYDEILTKMTYLFNGDVEKAKDLTSDVMMKVNEVIHKYSVESGSGKFGGWINKLAKNTFIDSKRNLKTKFEKNLLSIDNNFKQEEQKSNLVIKDYLGNPEQQIINKETNSQNNTILKEALKELDEIEIELIDLRYTEGLSYREISKKTKKTENFCRVKIKRALTKLKKSINS